MKKAERMTQFPRQMDMTRAREGVALSIKGPEETGQPRAKWGSCLDPDSSKRR